MEINVYTIPTCGWCTKLKDWLKKKKIAFIEHDLTESDHARDEMIEKSDQFATPVTIIKYYEDQKEDEELVLIKETVIVGFDEKKLEAALKE
ncbi:hypothetical protein HON71_01670 [Candidatus Woesearchaeota archaeon]|jgi:glutaredoxin 3|nr:hypothetical protein [Candidatus Woesearchaeota archaeon]MBT5342508.1 hypothetical protein [Candidatus Woesearchaeota archaeon]